MRHIYIRGIIGLIWLVAVIVCGVAVFFARQSAVLSVLLEWLYPIRGWKIESSLWHHPRNMWF